MLYEKHRGRPSLFEVPYGFKNLWDITVTSYNLATKSFLASDITAISLNGELVSGGQLRYLFDYNRDGCTLSQSGGDGLYVTLTQYDNETGKYGFRVLVDQNIEINGILGISGDMVNNANPNWPIIEHDDSKLDKAQYESDQEALSERIDEIAAPPPASTTTPGIVQLENSLTSDDESKALTAAQGKVLYDKINESDSTLVNTSDDQTVGGKKTFEEQLAVPGKAELPENASATEYATEAQVFACVDQLAANVAGAVQIANDALELIQGTRDALMVWEDWDETKEYAPLNRVDYERSTFLCLQPNANDPPPKEGNDNWLLIAAPISKEYIDGVFNDVFG